MLGHGEEEQEEEEEVATARVSVDSQVGGRQERDGGTQDEEIAFLFFPFFEQKNEREAREFLRPNGCLATRGLVVVVAAKLETFSKKMKKTEMSQCMMFFILALFNFL